MSPIPGQSDGGHTEAERPAIPPDQGMEGDGPSRILLGKDHPGTEPHCGGLLLVLGTLSLAFGILALVLFWTSFPGLALGVVSWVMARRDLRRMESGVLDAAGAGSTRVGRYGAILGTVFSVLAWAVFGLMRLGAGLSKETGTLLGLVLLLTGVLIGLRVVLRPPVRLEGKDRFADAGLLFCLILLATSAALCLGACLLIIRVVLSQ